MDGMVCDELAVRLEGMLQEYRASVVFFFQMLMQEFELYDAFARF